MPDGEGQTDLDGAVYAVKAGRRDAQVQGQMVAVAKGLIASGAEALLLACTEIPLVLGPHDVKVPVLDTLAILAQAAIREARRP